MKLRTLHWWTGVSACLFVFIIAVTGIVLDHRDQLKVSGKIPVHNKLEITQGTKPEELPISPAKAIEIALVSFGDGVQISKLELKKTGGGLVWKLETKSKDEIYIDPVTGTVHKTARGEMDIVGISKMLHTGEGLVVSAWFYDAIAIALVFLAISGAWMFTRKRLR